MRAHRRSPWFGLVRLSAGVERHRLAAAFAGLLMVVPSLTATTGVSAAEMDTPLPSPVRELSAKPQSATSVALTWRSADGNGLPIIDYRIEFSRDGSLWTVVNEGVSSAPSAVVDGLSQRAAYLFRVSAVTAAGTSLPVVANGPSDLSLGTDFTCALRSLGQLICWGLNNYKQTIGDWREWITQPAVARDSQRFVDIAAGDGFICGVDAGGEVWCWGRGGSGQLGNGIRADAADPIRVKGLEDVRQIAASGAHACALLGSERVSCWGANGSGEIGNGTLIDSLTPSSVSGLSDVTQLVAAREATCALTRSSEVWCWGDGYVAQSDRGFSKVDAPRQIVGVPPAKQIAAGERHACVVSFSLTVSCWGLNDRGQTGLLSASASTPPTIVDGIQQVSRLSAGGSTSCAVTVAGEGFCWGANEWGQLGNNANTFVTHHACWRWMCIPNFALESTDSFKPLPVRGVASAVDIAVGNTHACAVRSDASTVCWGRNLYGQLGSSQVRSGSSYSQTTCDYWVGCQTVWARTNSWAEIANSVDGFTSSQHFVSLKSVPSQPQSVATRPMDEAVMISWGPPESDGGSSVPLTYEVTANPSGQSCVTFEFSCVVKGLKNQVKYTFKVAARNDLGLGSPSSSLPIAPASAGFQAWLDCSVLRVGSATALTLAGATPGTKVLMTGAVKATVAADGDGRAVWQFVAPRPGIFALSVSNTVLVGKVNVKKSASIRAYAPKVVPPFWKVKIGKQGIWRISYAPPVSDVVVNLSNGTRLVATADAQGNAVLIASVPEQGLLTYSVAVANVDVASGALTVVP